MKNIFDSDDIMKDLKLRYHVDFHKPAKGMLLGKVVPSEFSLLIDHMDVFYDKGRQSIWVSHFYSNIVPKDVYQNYSVEYVSYELLSNDIDFIPFLDYLKSRDIKVDLNFRSYYNPGITWSFVIYRSKDAKKFNSLS